MQAYYSIAGRDLERDIVPMMQEEKLGLMVWSPLAGAFSGNIGPEHPATRKVAVPVRLSAGRQAIALGSACAHARDCREAGTSVATVALRIFWPSRSVTTVIIGAKRVEQACDQNLAAVDLKLDAADLKKLDEVSALAPEHPGWHACAAGSFGRRPEPFQPTA